VAHSRLTSGRAGRRPVNLLEPSPYESESGPAGFHRGVRNKLSIAGLVLTRIGAGQG